jgi:hypothetical protein
MKPSSFCALCTSNCAFELVGLLLSLSIFHTNANIYIISDNETKKIIENITPQPRLNIHWVIELDEYKGLNRFKMEQQNIFGTFLKNKMKIMRDALKYNKDVLLLDTDIIITDVIDDIDENKEVGLSRQYISEEFIQKTGKYNAGMLWTNSIDVVNNWENIIDNDNHCPEQINMIELTKHDYFEFPENYNFQCWRMIIADEPKEKIASYITSKPNDTLYYKDKPIKFVHTHFHDKRFEYFNNTIIQHMVNAKMYKLLAIVFRVIHNKWILKIPRQPLQGLGYHKNDSYRELALLMKINNNDVDMIYNNSMHCWLEPNILTYDRPTLQWLNNEINNASTLLLGNGDINKEGKEITKHFPNINVKPWIFWPRKPMILEKILKEKGITNYDDRTIESIFIGNIENEVQNKYRDDISWEKVLTEYHCTKGHKHKFSHSEYLMKLRDSKYGLCLRGYGSKCHREVELMAFGTIPIVTNEVSLESYMEPLKENVHYLIADSPDELKEKIENNSKQQWETMSRECYEWYQRNVDSKQAWNTMISHILYDN